MFRSRVFGPPDAFHVVLDYGSAEEAQTHKHKIRLPVVAARLEFDWTGSEVEASVVDRFVQRQSQLLQDNQQEIVKLHLSGGPTLHAASYPAGHVSVQLKVASSLPVLRSVHFTRTSGSGAASETLLSALLQHVDLSGVWRLKGCEGISIFWATCTEPANWVNVHSLNLSSCGLSALPGAVGQLGGLRVLRLNLNKLTSLPPELGQLVELEVLSVNNNQLTTLPAELRRCCRLRELHLEHNRLVTPLLDLTHATALASLQLYGNPLEYLPELAPAVGLRSISLANVRILADTAYSRWDVEVSAPSTSYGSYTSMVMGGRSHKLQPLFSLVFRRSSIQHPLLTGALSRLVEDPSNLELLVREDVALQQLVLASMASNTLVVEQAVAVIAAAGTYAGAAKRLVKHNVVQAITDLIYSQEKSLQLAGLRVLSSLAAGVCEGEVVGQVLVTTQLLDRLLQLIRDTQTPQEVRCAALHALGNSAFDPSNRRRYLQSPGLMQLLVALAAEPDSTHQNKDSSKDSYTKDVGSKHCVSNSPRGAQPPLAAEGTEPVDGVTQIARGGHDLGAGCRQETPYSGKPTSSPSANRPISPPTLIMDRNSSIRHQVDDCSAPKTSVAEGSTVGSKLAAVTDSTTVTVVEARSPRETTAGAVTAGATAAAAAGLTAVAEAVTAATKSIALAAVTAAGPANARKGSSDGGKTPRAPVAQMNAASALAAAAGAAAAVAAAPDANEDDAPNAAGSTSAPAAIGAEIGDKLLRKKRQNLVLVQDAVKLQAIRLLAVLGQNEQVRIALGQPPIRGRGLRVLAMDGGGMKGMAMVELLRQLERRAAAPIWTLFDVIGGTSTGGLLAVALGILRLNLDECQDIYTKLGNKVFHQSSASSQEEASWRESLYRMYATSSANMRVAVYGAKHDAAPYEELLRKFCAVQELGCASDRLIDTAVLGGPKVFVVATLASSRPAAPFAFRNYEVPDEAGPAAAALAACRGSCKHHVWEAVRASSAAPYYLDDFLTPDGSRFQDGATTANNPAALALQQARLLHPQLPIDCLVSLGCGSEPAAERSKGLSSVIDTGAVLLESACSVDRVHEALAATLPMVPGCRYFRFNPVDARCAMDLDDIKPESWRKLISATSEYCSKPRIAKQFDQLAHLLTAGATANPAPESASSPRIRRVGGSGQEQGSAYISQQQGLHPQQPATLLLNSNQAINLSRHLCSGARTQSAPPLDKDTGVANNSTEQQQQLQEEEGALDSTGVRGVDTAHENLHTFSDESHQGSRAAATAARLMYNKGILLVEAPRNVAASAAAAASTAGSAAATALRQHQQQEHVGQLLAAALPQCLLQKCNLSALTAAGTVQMHQQQQPRARYTPAAAANPWGAHTATCDKEQQQQQQQSVPEAGDGVGSKAGGLTVQAPTGNLHAAASPRSSSWFDWLSWQASPSGTPQQTACPRGQIPLGEKEAAAAAPAGGSNIGRTLSVNVQPARHSVASAQQYVARPYQSQQQQQQQQHSTDCVQLERQGSVSPSSPVKPTRSCRQQSLLAHHRTRQAAPQEEDARHRQVKGTAVTAASAEGLGAVQISISWPGSSAAQPQNPGRHRQPLQQQQQQNPVAAVLRDALSVGSAAGVGVLHLALQWTSGGLVGGWRQEVTAVVEPGACSNDVVSYAGADPRKTTLRQLVAASGPLLPTEDGGIIAVLGQQQVLMPVGTLQSQWATTQPAWQAQLCSDAFITSWVLQFTVPDEQRLVGEQEVYSLLSHLQQLIVVSSGWLPPGVVHVLLRGGVAAVVAAADLMQVKEVDARDVADFFRVFYEHLLQDGCDVWQALQGAAAAVPTVGPDMYECYQLV